MATTFVPFEIVGLDDQKLRNVDFVKGKLNEAMQAVAVRDAELKSLSATSDTLKRRAEEAERVAGTRVAEVASLRRDLETQVARLTQLTQTLSARDAEVTRLGGLNATLQKQADESGQLASSRLSELTAVRKELAVQAAKVVELGQKLDRVTLETPKIGVQALVNQFKGDIDRINAEVIGSRTSGMLVDHVEVEVRGGIDVRNGLQITQLPASALGEQSASVLRFNLRPTSALKIVDDEPPR